MKYRMSVCAVLLVAVIAGCSSAAMRNLLTEFDAAVSRRDSEKARSFIKEGVDANDAVRIIISRNPVGNEAEEFFVPLIKVLAKKTSFKDIPLYVGSTESGRDNQGNIMLGIPIASNKILEALLDGGADPDRTRRLKDRSTGTEFDAHTTMLFEILDTLGRQTVVTKDDKQLERVKILAGHKASLKSVGLAGGLFVSLISIGGDTIPTEAIHYFLAKRGLDRTSNLTNENLSSIVNVVKVLHECGAATGDAKDYLQKLREKYRNIPDAQKYIGEIEDAMKSSSWWSW